MRNRNERMLFIKRNSLFCLVVFSYCLVISCALLNPDDDFCSVIITSPINGAIFEEGDIIFFGASIEDFHSEREIIPEISMVRWVSDKDGDLGIQSYDPPEKDVTNFFSLDSLSVGVHEIKCITYRGLPDNYQSQCSNSILININETSSSMPYISGVVIDEIGPVAGATVRIQATTNATLTDSNGRFVLTGISVGESVTISAWKDGYYCAKIDNRSRRLISPPPSDVSLTLRLYQTYDNPDYTWMPPTGEESCASCKLAVTEVWLNNAHAGSANNSRFLSMYNGTDVNGNQSGPGFKIDYPDSAGNCAACHIPGAAVDDPNGIDPNEVTGADTFGIHCDYCHKVADVYLDDSSGLPYKDMPGVLSSDIRRPFPDDPERYQLFFGTFDDDNVPEEDTYLPLIEESQFCAPCHFGNVFGDTIVYNSFGEWLKSSYSDPETGMTCQDCHMPSPTIYNGETLTNVAPRKGGVERYPLTIHAHLQLGAMDSEFLQDALTMEVDVTREDDTVTVKVSITNDNTGHHIPTDSPLRHMILLVQAKDESGEELLPLDGPIVPEWVGEGNPDEGYYAGLPGKAYAKVLQEMQTGIIPSGAYWNNTQIVSDNRIAAFASDNSTYTFRTPENGTTNVTVTLLFRRAFIELMDQKGWNTPDIIMAQESISIGDED